MKLGEARWLWTLLMVAAAAAPAARGVWLDLPPTGSKCISEELHNNAVVLADYYAFIGEDYDVNGTTVAPSITVKVTSPYGNEIHHKEKVAHGQFAFTATEAGSYIACFSLDGDQGGKKVTVGIDWKTGIAAKDWDTVARKEKIEGLELELKKLEAAVETVHENLIHLVTREAQMRGVSETTNARVAWYSLMALAICIVASILQVLYLRRYFRKKKLI
ncbi:transmembrane emp24 domain-containing protein p24delta4-like [Salvia splendens]|uniref:transmembrane emp24 domain-containing protein p24delta4-like n=1 Tax=Salvia splendens TaxID=180675 RepID=UPI001C2760A0|nr:transmembrane emp24 domain-containing protein p24delta4-like [Salvia splendens]